MIPVERAPKGGLNPKEHNAQTLSECIEEQLNKHIGKETGKLIAQTYHGDSVMSGHNNSVQTKIKENYPNAQYIHF